MTVFNSLGSNYNFTFAVKALATRNNPDYSLRLKSFLGQKYQGKTVLTYKGREAIELALDLIGLPKNTTVAINGYTCYAVYKAIIDAGHKIEYLDISGSNNHAAADLNFSAAELQAKIKENPGIKVLIVQNTLGYAADLEKIAAICKEKSIILIEDLAHSAGTIYQNGKEAGSVGDFVALSFSQDKIIDAVSGGALIIRNSKYQDTAGLEFKNLGSAQKIRDRLYPFFTFKIRKAYAIGIGKILHALLKKTNLLSMPMGSREGDIRKLKTSSTANNLSGLQLLPHWQAALAYQQFQKLQENLKHRKKIAGIYAKRLNPKILSQIIIRQIPGSTNLRFPIFISETKDPERNRTALINYLKKIGIYVSDVWYDAPIAPKKYMPFTNYNNECPESDAISAQMLNLPTHCNISETAAEKIGSAINEWLEPLA